MRKVLTLAILLAVAGGAGTGASAAPKAELWDRWTAHDDAATKTVDHSAWARFLGTYVKPDGNGLNRVSYGAVTGPDRAALNSYVNALAGTKISTFNRAEQRAYWINLYNALTVKVILDHYPVDSIRDIDISPGLFSDGPWGKPLVTIEGEAVSLDDIEHRILRPIWRDPRVHYAVNCASVGCPNLMTRPFTASNADELMDRAARDYINHPRGARVADGKLVVSSIYEWFQEDFGGNDAGVIAHLKTFAAPDLAAALAGVTDIDDDAYDWDLNDGSAARAELGAPATAEKKSRKRKPSFGSTHR